MHTVIHVSPPCLDCDKMSGSWGEQSKQSNPDYIWGNGDKLWKVPSIIWSNECLPKLFTWIWWWKKNKSPFQSSWVKVPSDGQLYWSLITHSICPKSLFFLFSLSFQHHKPARRDWETYSLCGLSNELHLLQNSERCFKTNTRGGRISLTALPGSTNHVFYVINLVCQLTFTEFH